MRGHLNVLWRSQLIFIADEMFELLTRPSTIVLENANVRAMIILKQDDDDPNREIGVNCSEHPGESTLLSNIEEDDFDNQHQVLHPDQVRHDKTLWTPSVPLPNKWSRADSAIGCTSLSHLRHPAGAIAPPLLKPPKSALNILCESDVVPTQVLPLPKAGGDQNVPQPKASGDHNFPQHQKVTFEVAKWFMEAIIFTKTPWPINSDEKYSMVDEAWTLATEPQVCLGPLAGAPVGTPSVCQLGGGGPSLKIDPQTRGGVSEYSVSFSSIGLKMILNPNITLCQN